MVASVDSKQPSGWFCYPIPSDDADEPPARARNDSSWSPPHDDDPVPVTKVTLMPEYGVELPLWGADWWELGPTRPLLDELADWQEQFDTNFSSETGWLNDSIADECERRADALASAVAEQLPPDVPFGVDLWPIRRRSRRRRLEHKHHR